MAHVLDFLWALGTADFASEDVLHEVGLSCMVNTDAWEQFTPHRSRMEMLGACGSRSTLPLQDLALEARPLRTRPVLQTTLACPVAKLACICTHTAICQDALMQPACA